MGIHNPRYNVVPLEVGFQFVIVFGLGVSYIRVQSPSSCAYHSWRSCSDQRRSAKVDNEETMIADTKPTRHDACASNLDIPGSPDAVNGSAASEECSAELFTGECANHLHHIEPFYVCKSFPNPLGVNIFVRIHTDNQTLTLFSPLGQLFG